MPHFDYPWLLALAAMLPIGIVLLVLRTYRGRRARLERLGTLSVVLRLVPGTILEAPRSRAARVALAGGLVGIALAGPRWGEGRDVVRSRGIDMVLSLDASLSMLATDERPNRLEQMKEEVRRLRDLSPGDRVGLLAFAGRSYILSPLTVDQGALDLYLDNLDPSVVGEAGTSLARAIQQGVDLLSLSNSGTDKALVLMSDGEELDGTMDDITAQARRALEQGIALVTVGFGTAEGSTIPIRDGNVTVPKRYDGHVVITRYHPEFLQAAAAAAHGTFIDASATDKAGKIKSALSNLRAQSRASLGVESQVARYQWFLLPALLILLWDTLFPERRPSRKGAPRAAMATTAILTAAAASGCVRFTSDQGAVDAYKRGDFLQAAAQFRAAGARGRDPTRSYNLGTALVGADSLETAAEVLEAQTTAESSDLRYRALFNLGEAQLKRGIEQPDQGAREAMQAAAAAYKRVLLMRPDDMDAKWNYELASGGASARDQPQNAGALGQRQADQVLGTAAREERDTQAKKQQQNHAQPPPNGKDW